MNIIAIFLFIIQNNQTKISSDSFKAGAVVTKEVLPYAFSSGLSYELTFDKEQKEEEAIFY
jgi:hypothetical protein